MANMVDSNVKRVNLYLDEALLKKFDNYAEELHLNRSAAFAVMIRDYLRQEETLKLFMQLSTAGLFDTEMFRKTIAEG